jgi:hypothetical protein
MSTYKGARGPNVSQYVQQLNQLSPVQQPLDELAPSADDFSAFLNEDFYDVNGAPLPNFDVPIDLDADLSTTAQPSQSQPSLGNSSRKHSVQTSAGPNMEFNLGGEYTLSLLPSCIPSCPCPSLRAVWPAVVYCVQIVGQ